MSLCWTVVLTVDTEIMNSFGSIPDDISQWSENDKAIANFAVDWILSAVRKEQLKEDEAEDLPEDAHTEDDFDVYL